MAQMVNQDFIRGTASQQRRSLIVAGLAFAVVIALVVGVMSWVYPRATEPDGVRFSVVVPALGPGVKQGSKVLLSGTEVGTVTDLTQRSDGAVTMGLAVGDAGVDLLDDQFQVDFRPENYFGITGVNLKPGGRGAPIRAGQVYARHSAEDYTMSTMIESGSLMIDGTLTTEVIASLDEVMRYADGLAPLIRSGLIVADQVAKTQQALPSVHLRRMNAILGVLPGFEDAMASALFDIFNSAYNRTPDGRVGLNVPLTEETDETLALLGSDLFGAAGTLLASHDTELTPVVEAVRVISDGAQPMVGGKDRVAQFAELISRLDGAFTGSDDHKTLQLRLVLGSLPSLAAPMTQMGLGPDRTRNTGGGR